MIHVDENNNEYIRHSKSGLYVERHLLLGPGTDFLVIPNGGSGDCMFKAVSQAVYDGDESKHREIRMRLVNYIITQRWEKFVESIEVQHINGNNLLERQWAKDPKEAYRLYMCMAGTLGSSSELTAAAELFRYNFATIQEYSGNDNTTYRVENCVTFDEEVTDFHYFYFTGDFDNGHWENIKKLSFGKLDDGTYPGQHRIVINSEEISFEDWLRRETENNNEADQLKVATDHNQYVRRRTSHPFELRGLSFCPDGTVLLRGNLFTVANGQFSDLFSVLANECLKNEGSAHDIELILMKHRYSFFEDINYKLITQPWSHHFTVDAIRYCGQSLKGNIQDLIAAADLYSFSFVLFLKMSDEEDTHQCKFSHVDRWGGESDRILYFFMRLSRNKSCEQEQLIAKWWRLIPVQCTPTSSDAKLFCQTSRSENADTNGNSPRMISAKPSLLSAAALQGKSVGSSKLQQFQASDLQLSPSVVHTGRSREGEPPQTAPSGGSILGGPHAQESDDGINTDECLQHDHYKIFHSFVPLGRARSCQDERQVKSAGHFEKQSTAKRRIKPATGKDLLEHPEKIKTLVRLSDRGNSDRTVTYTGNGYLRADDVLSDLMSQGLIRISSPVSPRAQFSLSNEQSPPSELQRILSAGAEGSWVVRRDKSLTSWRDENYNVLDQQKNDHDGHADVYVEEHIEVVRSKCGTPLNEPMYTKSTTHYIITDEGKLTVCPKRKTNKVSPSGAAFVGSQHRHSADQGTCCLDPVFIGLRKLAHRISKMSRSIKKKLRNKYKPSRTSSSSGENCQDMSPRRQKHFPLKECAE